MTDNQVDAAMPCRRVFTVGQLVFVQPRTWAGINRPGGVGRISRLHSCTQGYVETVDVKYVVSKGCDAKIDLDFVEPHEELERQGRSRRGRDFLTVIPPKQEKKDAVESTKTKKSPSTTTAITIEQQAAKKRRTVTPQATQSPATPAAASRAISTKASTNHGLTLQTGSEIKSVKKAQTKPPVKVVRIPAHGMTLVSPLPEPPAAAVAGHAGESTSVSSNGSITSYAVKRPTDKTKTQPQPTNATVQQTEGVANSSTLIQKHRNNVNPASASFKRKLAKSPRPLPLSATRQRIPLRQVFDQSMNKRNTFVKDVVGQSPSGAIDSSTKKAVAIVEKVAAVKENPAKDYVDNSHQEIFNKCLSQLFLQTGDSVSQQALIEHVNTSITSAQFTAAQVDDFLQHLASEDRIMVSDGEIYQI